LAQTVRKVASTLANRAFLILLGATLFYYINVGMTFSTATYVLTYYWEMPQAGFLVYSIVLFVGVIGAFLLVGFLQSRIEKRTGAVVCGLISLAFGLSPYLLRFAGLFPENSQPSLIPVLFTFVTISNGLAVAAGILTTSMAADIIEASQEKTGERTEGLFFSAYFFTQKCATGMGIFLAGNIVSASGFPAKARPGEVPAAVLDNFAIYYVIVLAVISLIGTAIISRFPITRAEHDERIAKLAAPVEPSGAPP
jgi:GPH family glycoside/pentoside/hexuronide:cation symporter